MSLEFTLRLFDLSWVVPVLFCFVFTSIEVWCLKIDGPPIVRSLVIIFVLETISIRSLRKDRRENVFNGTSWENPTVNLY